MTYKFKYQKRCLRCNCLFSSFSANSSFCGGCLVLQNNKDGEVTKNEVL